MLNRTDIFEALADDRRLAILRVLASGEKCVCDVSAALGISDSLASHHLKKLREAGLVRTRRKGLWLHCSLDAQAIGGLAEELRLLGMTAASAPSGCCDDGEAARPASPAKVGSDV